MQRPGNSPAPLLAHAPSPACYGASSASPAQLGCSTQAARAHGCFLGCWIFLWDPSDPRHSSASPVPTYMPAERKGATEGETGEVKGNPPTHPDNRAARAFPESAPVKPEDFQTKKSDYFCPDHHHHLPATPHSHRQAAHNSRQPAPEDRQTDTVHKHTHRAELT